MFHTWDITIPAGRTDAAPLRQELKLTVGIIKRVEIKFPSGCHGLVKVRLFRWNFQLVPLSAQEYVTGDSETVPSETYYELLETPMFLTFEGSSPLCSYDHRITVRINVEPAITAQEEKINAYMEKVVEALT